MSLPVHVPRPQRPATYEDLLRVPDTKVAEIISGELIVSPRPSGPHAISTSGLGEELGPPFKRGRGGPGGWWILDEPELHLDKHVLVPDLAGWRRERMPVYPADPFVTLPPDWVCEVVSDDRPDGGSVAGAMDGAGATSTCRIDRIRKLPIYAEFEIRHTWLVDPDKQTLEVYRLEHSRWVLVGAYEGDAEVRAEPFDAIALNLAILWDRGQPPEPKIEP